MGDILLNDILQLSPVDIERTRVKLNVYNGKADPLDLYKADPEAINTDWLLWHKARRYFRKGQIALCLLDLGNDRWLLTTMKKIYRELDVKDEVGYEATQIPLYAKYYGRLIVHFHNNTRVIGRRLDSIMNDLKVLEILPVAYTGDEFPGYENIRLSWSQLSIIVSRPGTTWINALKNQKAVYLITDTNTGKLYVGSATAQNGMLLQRWKSYAGNGHGGNVKLKSIVSEKGFDYVKQYFQYSVLENYNAKMDDEYILRREAWWKETLCSRTHGYNGN